MARYAAILPAFIVVGGFAAPVDTEELVTAEALWIATRAGVYGCVPMLVAMVFGLDPAWGMFAVPGIAFITGFGWAAFGVLVSAIMKSADTFSYVTSLVVTPAFLLAAHELAEETLTLRAGDRVGQ